MSATIELPLGRKTAETFEDVPPDLPPLPSDASPEQKDLHWYTHVYRGDRVPQLTIRAVAMGAMLGMLMSVSNLYTTLKVGWSFGVAITSCVLSFVIWNALRALSAGRLTPMSIKRYTQLVNQLEETQLSADITLESGIEQGLFVCGSPATVKSAFENYWKDMGFGNLLVMCQFGTLPPELTRKNMELFAREVMPALKKLN